MNAYRVNVQQPTYQTYSPRFKKFKGFFRVGVYTGGAIKNRTCRQVNFLKGRTGNAEKVHSCRKREIDTLKRVSNPAHHSYIRTARIVQTLDIRAVQIQVSGIKPKVIHYDCPDERLLPGTEEHKFLQGRQVYCFQAVTSKAQRFQVFQKLQSGKRLKRNIEKFYFSNGSGFLGRQHVVSVSIVRLKEKTPQIAVVRLAFRCKGTAPDFHLIFSVGIIHPPDILGRSFQASPLVRD